MLQNKKYQIIFIVLVPLFVVVTVYGITHANSQNAKDALSQYYQSIDYSCQVNEDCVVRDIRNCCGAYPACVNKNAVVDPAIVEQNCREQNMASVCGFEDISSCQCVEGHCQGAAGTGLQEK